MTDYYETVQALRYGMNRAFKEHMFMLVGFAKLALKLGYHVGMAQDDDGSVMVDDGWGNILFIELPTGQVAWHVHDNDMELFDFLDFEPFEYDGHTLVEKYARVMDVDTERMEELT